MTSDARRLRKTLTYFEVVSCYSTAGVALCVQKKPLHQERLQFDDDDEEKKPEETQEGQPSPDMASEDNALAVSIAVPQMGAAADITGACEFYQKSSISRFI